MTAPHDEELEAWMAALGGSDARDGGAAAAEGRRLRGAILREGADAAAAAAARPDARSVEAVVARLRREGLLEPLRPARRARRAWGWAAGALALALAGWWLVPPPPLPYPEPPSYRGGLTERSAKVADPRAAAEGLAAALRQRGVEASIHASGRRLMVDLDVGEASREAVRAELARWAPGAEALPLPDGTLRVRLERR